MIRALVLFVVLATATSVSHATTWRFDFTTTTGGEGTFFLDTTLVTVSSPIVAGIADFFGQDLVNFDSGAIATEPGDDQLRLIAGSATDGGIILTDNFSVDNAVLFLSFSTMVPTDINQDFSSLATFINLPDSFVTFGSSPSFPLGSLTVTQVPLPAAAWLFLSALAGLGMMRNRRRTQLA